MSRLLKITDLGSGIMVQGTDNVLFPDNATLTYPYNSIVVVTDESDMVTFRSAANNDVLFSGIIGSIQIGSDTVTKQNINAKFDAIANQESGGGDMSNYYTKEETNALIPTEVSELTNDAGYITQEQVIINESFPSGWHTSGTMSDLISDINNDSDALVGKVYMGTVEFSDLPSGLMQAELQVEIMSEMEGIGKVLVFTVTSSDVSPYHWEYTSAYGNTGTWRSWANSTDIANFFDGAEYDSQTKRINFKHSSTVITYIDATAFIKDGMVDSVAISNGNLVITFNTDAGKQPISIPLTDIFNPANYYDKTAADARFAQISSLANVATSGSYTDLSNTPVIPAPQVQSDWNATTGMGVILNKPDLGDYVEKSVYNQKELATAEALMELKTEKQDELVSGTSIKTINNESLLGSGNISITAPEQIQSDWNQSDDSKVDFIKNKPVIPDTSNFVSKSTFDTSEEVTARALTQLNTNKLDASAAFSGNYNDLTNKPTIPDAVSGTNDGTNWTTITIGSTTKAIPSGGGGGGNYVQFDSGNQVPVLTISRMNRLEYEQLAGYEDPNTLYIVTPIEWEVIDNNNFQFGDGNPTDLFAQTLPAQEIALNEYPTVTLYEDLDMGSSPIQGSWSYDSSEYIGTLTWTDSDGGSCSMVIEFSVVGGSYIVIDDASKITYTNPNNHCYTVEWV